MKKALMYATTASMIKQFNMENIRLLQELGYQVEVACNMEQGSSFGPDKIAQFREELRYMGIQEHHISTSRSVLNVKALISSICQTVKLMNENSYDLIHCHTPIGSVVCRIAHRLSKHYKTAKMLYTAHGFHFFKGAPKTNWLLFYPMEKLCSRYTDVIITINKEDYKLASTRLKAGRVEYVPGVGVDTKKFAQLEVDPSEVRRELGIPADKTWVLCVGELIPRKDHETLIRAAAQVPELFVTIAGRGDMQPELEALAEDLGIGDRVKLLGFRSDVPQMCKACDLYAFPSLQEGLPVAVMEAMAFGKAVVCTDVRGNHDLIETGKGGFLLPVKDVAGFAEKLAYLAAQPQLRKDMGEYNAQKMKGMDVSIINDNMRKIYQEV